ncbi:2-oxo-tetronate isomerase [Thaumasiovibrio sp. DFM-14]|uniref:2-oxo-tetronate isomerase n=1 Tax=Thaumasiovibrio sp. DFM-14 TaxID=3384792 RepID=UPI0039A1D4D6
MPKFAANLTMLFTEKPFMARFDAAAQAGFSSVEFLFPYAQEIHALQQKLSENQLNVALFNAPAGNWELGERGLAAIVGREDEFRLSIKTALQYGKALDVPRIHVMSGIAPVGGNVTFDEKLFIENIRWAADEFANVGIELLLEPLNQRDNPGYFLSDYNKAIALISAVDRPNVKLQFDFYHAQIIAGDLSENFKYLLPLIGHIQIASIPQRNEPNEGEVNYSYLFDLIDKLGYTGIIGCEYNPKTTTDAGIGWVRPYL